jgi:hypothetical protein
MAVTRTAARGAEVVQEDPAAGPPTMEGEDALVEREVIAKGRNALIVYGETHFPRKSLLPRQ